MNRILTILLSAFFLVQASRAQSGGGDPAGALTEKARRYHDLLLKKPKPGAIFERFESAWLETGSIETLKSFLSARASAANASLADRLVLGFFLSQQNDHEEAIAAFAKALEASAGNVDAWLLRAQAEARMLDFTAALKSLEHIPEGKLEDTELEAAKLRSRLLIRTGETEKALSALQKIVAAKPEDEEFADDLVELQVEEGLLADAISFLSGSIEKTNDAYLRVMRRLRLGDLHQRAGRKDDALDAYVACLADAGQDSWVEGEVIAQIEQVFRRKDDLAGLRAFLDKIAPDHAQRVSLGLARARIMAEDGDPTSALALLADLISKNPGVERLREQHIDLLTKLQKYDDAIAQVRELLGRHPADKELKFKLCGLYYQAKKDAPAVGILDEMLADPDVSEQDHMRIARFFESVNEPADARRVLQKAAAKYPESVVAQEVLAGFLHAHQERDRALLIWRKLAEKGGKEDVLRIARALSARSEHELALELLKKIAGAAPERTVLAQMILCAAGAKKEEEAMGWALQLVATSGTAQELEDGIRLARMVHRDPEAAAKLITDLRSRKDANAAELCLLSEILEDSGDPDGAEAALARVPPQDTATALRQRARLARRRQDYEKAAAVLEQLVALPGGKNAENVEALATSLSRARRHVEALKWISEWKALQPGSSRPWLEEAAALKGDNRAAAAIESMRVAARKFEDDPAVASALAEAYRAAGQLADAQRVYADLFEKATELGSQLRWAGMIAQMAMENGKLNGLIASFQERQRGNRQSVSPWLVLAEMHRATGNYEKRRQALLEAARVKPDDLDLLHQIARAEEGEGDWRSAVDTLEKALPHDKTTKTKERIAALHFAYGEEETGLRLVAEMAGGDKMDPRLAESLALGVMQNDNWAAAAKLVEPVLARQAEDYRLRCLHAICLEELGRKDEAVEEYLRLCSARTELPGVTPARQDERQYVEFPPGVEPLAKLSYAVNTVNARRYFESNRQQMRWSAQGGQSQQNIWILPASVADAPFTAAAHLMTLSADWPEARKTDLVRRVRETGFDSAQAMLDFKPGENGGLDLADSALPRVTTDPVFASWWLGSALEVTPGSAADQADFSAKLEKIVPLLRKNHPSLAMRAAVKLWQEDPAKNRGAARTATEILAEIPPQHSGWLEATMDILSKLPEELRRGEDAKAILGGIVGVQERRKKTNPTDRSHANWWTAFVRIRQGALDEFLKVLDDEAVAWRNRDVINELHTNARGYRPSGVQIQALDFPLRQVPDLPDWIPGMLGDRFAANMGLSDDEVTTLKSKAAQVKDPLIRIYLLAGLDDTDAAEKLAYEQAEAPMASMTELLVAAALAQGKDDHVRAAGYLARARSKGGSLMERGMIDSALTHSAVEAISRGKRAEIEPHLAAAKAAALHMRYLMSGGSSLEPLAEALAKLDMADESARIKKLIAATQSSSSSSSSFQKAGPDDFEKLVKSGRRDQAMALAIRALRSGADQMITNQGGFYFDQRDWIAEIQKAGLLTDIWQAVQTPATATWKQRLQFALVAEMLDHKAEAREMYETCLKDRPRDALLRFRLAGAMLGDKGEPAAALAQLLQADKRDAASAAEQWARIVDNSKDLAMRNKAVETMALFLEHWAKTPDDAPLGNWIESWENLAIEQIYLGEKEAPHLLAAQEDEKVKADRDSPLMKGRREAYEKYARAGMKHPVTGVILFPAYAAYSIKEKHDLAPVEQTARDVIRALGEATRKRPNYSGWAAGQFRPIFYRSNDEVEKLAATDFLVMQAWRNKKPESVEKEIVPLVKQTFGPDAARSTTAFAALYFCPESEFLATLQAYRKAQPAAYRDGDDEKESRLALRLWEQREMKLPVERFIIPEMERAIKQGSWFNRDQITGLAVLTKERSGSAAVERLLESVTTTYLGPKEGWRDFVAKNATKGNRTYSNNASPSWRVDQLSDIFDEVGDAPEVFFDVLKVARAAGFEKARNYDEIRECSGLSKLARTPDKAWAFIESSGFLDDIETLDVMPASDPNAKSMLETILPAIARDSRTYEKTPFSILLSGKLDAMLKGKPTWGTLMLAATTRRFLMPSLSVSPDAKLSGYGPRFAKLPPERQTELALVLRRLFPDLEKWSFRSAEIAAGLAPLLEAMKAASGSQAERLRTAKTFAELGMSQSEFRDLAYKTFIAGCEENPVAAADLFAHAMKLVEDEQRASGWSTNSSYADNGYNIPSALLSIASTIFINSGVRTGSFRGTVTYGSNSPFERRYSLFQSALATTDQQFMTTMNRIKALLNLFTRPEQRQFVHYGYPYSYGWSATMHEAFGRLRGTLDPEKAALAISEPFFETAAKGGAMLAVLPFTDIACSGLMPWQMERISAALRASQSQPAGGLLADAVEIALTLAAIQGWNGPPLDPGAPLPDVHRARLEKAAAWMKNSDCNPMVRISFAAQVLHRSGVWASTEMAHEAVALLSESLEQKWPVGGYLMRYILTPFNAMPKDASWSQSADRFMKAWLQRCAADETEDKDYGRGYWPERAVIFAPLELFARSGNSELLDRFLRLHTSLIEKSAIAAAILTRHGATRQARPIIERTAETCDGYNEGATLSFNRQDEQGLAATLPTLRASWAKAAATIFSSAPYDARTPAPYGFAGSLSWDERLGAAAKMLLALKDADVTNLPHLWRHLNDSPAAGAVMLDWMKERAKTTRAESLLFAGTEDKDVVNLVLLPAFQTGIHTDARPWIELISTLAAKKPEYWRNHLARMRDILYDQGRIAIRDGDEKMAERLVAMCDPLVFDYLQEQKRIPVQIAALRAGLLARLDKQDTVDWKAEWIKLPRGPSIDPGSSINGVLERLAYALCIDGLDNRKLRPEEVRLRVIKSILGNHPLTAPIADSANTGLHKRPLQLLRARGVISTEEIRRHALDLFVSTQSGGVLADAVQVFLEAGDKPGAVALVKAASEKLSFSEWSPKLAMLPPVAALAAENGDVKSCLAIVDAVASKVRAPYEPSKGSTPSPNGSSVAARPSSPSFVVRDTDIFAACLALQSKYRPASSAPATSDKGTDKGKPGAKPETTR